MGSPKQKGFIQLEGGSLGETTFVKTKDGNTAREKKVQNKRRWYTAPEFQRSRENAETFGTSSVAAKMIMHPAKAILVPQTDITMFHRLKTFITRVIAVDGINPRGKCTIQPFNTPYFLGYELNQKSSLRSLFNTRYTTSINRQEGVVEITIPSFIPTQRIQAPKGTTHFEIIAAGADLDFVKKDCQFNVFKVPVQSLDDTPTEDLHISFNLPPNSIHPVFVYLGLRFTQVTNGETHQVAQARMNPAAIVNVFNEGT